MSKRVDKQAVVTSALRYREANDGVLSNHALIVLADQFGVSSRSIRRWVNAATDVGAPPVKPRKRQPAFEMGQRHLVAIRKHQNLKRAHAELFPPGCEDPISYPTFTRAFGRLSHALRAGLLGGAADMANAQIYLSTTAPHVNHTWHMDHKEADIWVTVPRGRIAKPWVSTVRDSATGAWLAAIAYMGRPNEDTICDTLATAAAGRRYDLNGQTVEFGGLPVQLVLDNAAEHFAQAVVRGSVLMGVVVAPTRAYEKQANGLAENTHSVIADVEKSMPGWSKAKSATLAAPLTPGLPGDVDLSNLMSIESYQRRLDALIDEMNTKQVRRLGGRSRVQAWHEDPTERRAIPPESLRLMMLREARGRVVNAEGIRFRGRDYLAPELTHYRERGLTLTVGYLNRETRFIDVFDDDGVWICRAYDRELLTEGQRFQILAARSRDRALLAQIDALAKEDARHEAAGGVEYDTTPDDLPHSDAALLDAALDNVVPMSAQHPAVERTDPTTPRTVTVRPKRTVAPARTTRVESRSSSQADEEALLAKIEERRALKAERDRLKREQEPES